MTRAAFAFSVLLCLGPAICTAAEAHAEPAEVGPDTQPQTQPAAGSPSAATTTVVESTGTVRIRAAADAPWKPVEPDMVLPVGTEVQTGLRGSLTLDIGPSARVTVERLSHFTIGRLNRRGEVMHTLVAVKHGKIDFKVKRVGFRNDFRIASPTGTMAVKGTGGEFDTGEGGQFNYDPDPDNDNDSTSYNDNSSNNDTTFSGDEGSDNNGGYGGRGNPNLTQGGVGSNMTGSRGDDDDFLDGEPDGLNGGRDELNGNTTNRNNNELFEDELGEEDDSGGGV